MNSLIKNDKLLRDTVRIIISCYSQLSVFTRSRAWHSVFVFDGSIWVTRRGVFAAEFSKKVARV